MKSNGSSKTSVVPSRCGIFSRKKPFQSGVVSFILTTCTRRLRRSLLVGRGHNKGARIDAFSYDRRLSKARAESRTSAGVIGGLLLLPLLQVSGCAQPNSPTSEHALAAVAEVADVPDKLDPRLAEMVERAETARGTAAKLDVLVGLHAELDAAARAELTALGLAVRSEVGTVLTGSVDAADVRRRCR